MESILSRPQCDKKWQNPMSILMTIFNYDNIVIY